MECDTMKKPYSIKGSLVRDHIHQRSYNMTSKIDAENLYNTLTKYHQTTTLNKDIETKYDQITKQLIQIEMSMKILESEIKTLTQLVKQ
jgi:5-methylcytosine-specific restriction endonuclease McrA